MASRSGSRTGVAAILAGVLIFAGQGGELAFSSDPAVLNVLEVVLFALGFAALVVAVWRLGRLVSTRIGRPDRLARLRRRDCVSRPLRRAGARHGDPDGRCARELRVFGIGFLLLFVGHLLIAAGLRDTLGRT
jgi:hypothetical protein